MDIKKEVEEILAHTEQIKQVNKELNELANTWVKKINNDTLEQRILDFLCEETGVYYNWKKEIPEDVKVLVQDVVNTIEMINAGEI